jgi:hypothetical protein
VILVDTSVWVEHLRSGNATLATELGAGPVLAHPFVIGELACGTLRNRREVLDLLGRLPSVPTATHAEALDFLERRALMGRGIGFVDVLIACAFNYEACATEFSKLGRIPVLKARMNADLHMAEELKNTGKGNLFVIFGVPVHHPPPRRGWPRTREGERRGRLLYPRAWDILGPWISFSGSRVTLR